MNLHVGKIPEVVQEYILTNVVAGAPTDLAKFGVGFAAPYIADMAKRYATGKGSLASALGIVDSAGLIDIDKAALSAKGALKQTGGKLSAFGLIFSAQDIDSLVAIARKYGGENGE